MIWDVEGILKILSIHHCLAPSGCIQDPSRSLPDHTQKTPPVLEHRGPRGRLDALGGVKAVENILNFLEKITYM